jgi:hypothetical protein
MVLLILLLLLSSTPANGGANTYATPEENWFNLGKGVDDIPKIGPTRRYRPSNLPSAFDCSLDARVKTDIELIRRGKAQNEPHESVRIVVKVEQRRVLNTAAIKVEEPDVVSTNHKYANKSSIGLVYEHLSMQ